MQNADADTMDLKGKLLIALPSIGDDRFDRSVILICAHQPDYAMGIVVNKPVYHISVSDVLDQLDVPVEIELPEHNWVLDGGPVGNDRGFVLHSADFHCEGATMAVGEDCHLTATRDVLIALGSDKAPAHSTLALGYAGWGAGQLERELAANAWLVGPANHELIYGIEHDDKWDEAIEAMGINSGMLQHHPGRA